MCESFCGAECDLCDYGKNNGCKGCIASNGCPAGKPCFIFNYIKTSGMHSYVAFEEQLISEFNSLGVPGMPEIHNLYAMNGEYVNLAYPMPNGYELKLLDDKEVYLCNQVQCEFNDGELMRCFGLVAGMDFLLVAEYGENCSNPELIVYKKR